jgi:protein-tyrosine phosphatase
MISVLFVCTGNICRSPMAEAVFKNLVHQAGLDDQFSIDSAGISGYHAGERAHSGTLSILAKNGIIYDGRSRRLIPRDLEDFDYVVAMDDEHVAEIKWMGGSRGEVSRLLDYAPGQPEREVPDPYYDGNFEHVYGLVLAGAEGLLAHIREQQGI